MPEPDDHNYLDEECSEKGCGYQAIEQDWFETPLCAAHLKKELAWDQADMERL